MAVVGSQPVLARDWLVWPDLDRIVTLVARRYRVNSEDLPDLMQEVRLTIWKAGENRPVNATWIFKVVASRVLDRIRIQSGIGSYQFINVHEDLPDASCGDAELLYLLRARLCRLPQLLQRFCDLRFAQDMSQREIAREMQLSRRSVRGLKRRCRLELTGSAA